MANSPEASPISTGIDSFQVEIDMLADIPESASSLVASLEKNNIAPDQDLSISTFTSGAIWFSYPDIIRDYINILSIEPIRVEVELSKEKASNYSSISISIFFDERKVTIEQSKGKPLDAPYTVTATNADNDLLHYSCSPHEVGELLSSMILSANDAEDVTIARVSNPELEPINPRNPQLFPLLRGAIERKADEFDHRRIFERLELKQRHTPFDTSDDIGSAPSMVTLRLETSSHYSGASSYDVKLEMIDDEGGIDRQCSIHSFFEITDVGHISRADVSGVRSVNEGNPAIDKASCVALLNSAMDMLRNDISG